MESQASKSCFEDSGMCPDTGENEVIIPANTFIACANATVYAVGGKPVFCDINSDTYCTSSGDRRSLIRWIG